MDNREAKLALARKKLKDHQEKKVVQKDENVKPEISACSDVSMNYVQNINTSYAEALHAVSDSEHNTEIIYSYPADSSSTLNNVITGPPNGKPSTLAADVILPSEVNVTEILISSKRNLELQVNDLQVKLNHLDQNHSLVINDLNMCKQKVCDLEKELKNVNTMYINASQELLLKNKSIDELMSVKSTLSEQKCNLSEQLEFTKGMLNNKEIENDSLHKQVNNLQNQNDLMQLQMQQLTNGSSACLQNEKSVDTEKNEVLLQKICNLEQQISLMQKERDQMTLHYEHYVVELSEQLKSALKKNEELCNEVQTLSNRENSLIDQISDMEIRIQKYNVEKKDFEIDQNTINIKGLQDDVKHSQAAMKELQHQYEELQIQYAEREAKFLELTALNEARCNQDNISITKLSADMTSDKIAAQRATEQNKKLKQDIQGLEDAFVKMSKDKLELTEKLTAEKYLNRELTIKLAEIDENAKSMEIKLKAKDEEMIRLQTSNRDIQKECDVLKSSESSKHSDDFENERSNEQATENINIVDLCNNTVAGHNHACSVQVNEELGVRLPKAEAMSQLQVRFLKIMDEVANLSDEKHRLEHIILQLQNETDTICEYVALYQQQRSLLKRRDDERSAQLKIFQQECGKLKTELEQLSGILSRFAEDSELLSYFQNEAKRSEMDKVIILLNNLKNNSLVDPVKKNLEFNNFYPCNCCSGKLIDV